MPDRESNTPKETPEPLRMPETVAELREMLHKAARTGAITILDQTQKLQQIAGNYGDLQKENIPLPPEAPGEVFNAAVQASDTLYEWGQALNEGRTRLEPNPLTGGQKLSIIPRTPQTPRQPGPPSKP